MKLKSPISRNTIRSFKYKTAGIFKNLKPDHQIALFCDPRGGSTWLAQTLKAIPKSCILDEPLHLTNFPELRHLNFHWLQHIPDDVKWEEAKNYFTKIQSGQILNYALCSLNTAIEVTQTQVFLLKIIRGKALLPWYVKQFDLKYPPLYMVRHPFAMAASKMAHPAWNYPYDGFNLPQTPHNEIYQKHLPFLQKLKTKEEYVTAKWCIGNNNVLRNKANNKSWISVNYENILLHPEQEFSRIFNRWNLKIPNNLLEEIQQPSATAINKKVITKEEQLRNWKHFFSDQQISRLMNVLEYFEVDYYNLDPMPIIDADKITY